MTRRALTLGVDFGTESVRAVLLDLGTGDEIGESVWTYPHGIISEALPDSGVALPADWALQHPSDWLDGMTFVVRAALTHASADDVIGIGIDFTACTVLPTTQTAESLCLQPEWTARPHAWPKLWKHHAAQSAADSINEAAADSRDLDLADYGGRLSSEWLLPKSLQVLREDPEVFHVTERIIEAQDWVTWLLCGVEARSAQAAGFKAAFRAEGAGYPSAAFLDSVEPGFSSLLSKLSEDVHSPGARVGGLTIEWAERLGLPAGIAVATGNMDAQVSVVGCGTIDPGDMTIVMGTSACNLLVADANAEVEGMSGAVYDAVVPSLWCLEAGQASVGDLFGWFTRNAVPASYERAADAAGLDVHGYLSQQAARIPAGRNSVIALDWWNGNRSVLTDDNLSGVLLGMTLATRPEHVYRALLEAAAFGQRIILESFESSGVPVERIVTCGGLTHRSPLFMQILADVTGREILLSRSLQTSARGAAVHAAAAAGVAAGGFGSLAEAARELSSLGRAYHPDLRAHRAYEAAYHDYRRLHDLLGRSNSDLMRGLRSRAGTPVFSPLTTDNKEQHQ